MYWLKRKPIILTIVMVLAAAVLLTACGPGSTGEGGQADDSPEILYMASAAPPVMDWDPSIFMSSEITVMANFYETLLRYNSADNTFTPILATDYTKSEDGLVWTFNIREGVTFHDGSTMDAHDVVWSLDRSKNINKGASFIWDPVAEFKALDDYTVQITLEYAAPLDLIVSCCYGAYIMNPEQAEQGLDWFQAGNECGTGPYMLQSSVPGDEVVMTRHETYWGGWEGKHFDKVVVKQVVENASRRQMLESGEADITQNLLIEDMIAMQSNPDLTVYTNSSYMNQIGFYNTQVEPFDNKLVRQALNYAFPYQDIIDYVYQGFAELPTGPIPTKMWGALDEVTYTYDLEKAKQLLTEAGYPDGGFDMQLTYMSSKEEHKKICELYKSNLEQLGISVEIIGMPWDQQWEKAKSTDPEDRQDWLIINWWPDVATPSSWFQSLYHSEDDIIFNMSYVNNPELDALIDEADRLSGNDREAAAELYKQCGQLITDEAYSNFLTDLPITYIIRNNLKNFSEDPAYPYALFFYDFYRE